MTLKVPFLCITKYSHRQSRLQKQMKALNVSTVRRKLWSLHIAIKLMLLEKLYKINTVF